MNRVGRLKLTTIKGIDQLMTLEVLCTKPTMCKGLRGGMVLRIFLSYVFRKSEVPKPTLVGYSTPFEQMRLFSSIAWS